MQNRGRRVAFAALLALVGAGAAATAARAAETGDHRLRLIRSWPENPVVDGRSVPGRVEIWFDYTAGVAIHKVVANAKGPGGADRVIKSETFAPGFGAPTPSVEEIAEAMEMVRADKEVARVIAATHAVLDGGFQIFEPEGKPCGPGSRCLEVQLMTQDRLGFIRNVIVDLTKQAIVYRTYLPAEEGKGK
jgi:hypothetical protein